MIKPNQSLNGIPAPEPAIEILHFLRLCMCFCFSKIYLIRNRAIPLRKYHDIVVKNNNAYLYSVMAPLSAADLGGDVRVAMKESKHIT